MTVEQVEIVNFAAIWCILKCIGRTLNDTIDTAEEGGLERVEAEALDNELALVAELHVHGMSYDGQRRRPAGDDAGGRDVECELVLEDGELLDIFREALEEVGAVGVQLLRSLRILGDRRIGRGWLREGGCGRYAL